MTATLFRSNADVQMNKTLYRASDYLCYADAYVPTPPVLLTFFFLVAARPLLLALLHHRQKPQPPRPLDPTQTSNLVALLQLLALAPVRRSGLGTQLAMAAQVHSSLGQCLVTSW